MVKLRWIHETTNLRIHRDKKTDNRETIPNTIIKQWMPGDDSILYYYCSANSFMSIVKNKTLRFSDLYHMNDLSELQHGDVAITEKTTEKILSLISENPNVTTDELANMCNITPDGVFYHTKRLREKGVLIREGGRKDGRWIIVKK